MKNSSTSNKPYISDKDFSLHELLDQLDKLRSLIKRNLSTENHESQNEPSEVLSDHKNEKINDTDHHEEINNFFNAFLGENQKSTLETFLKKNKKLIDPIFKLEGFYCDSSLLFFKTESDEIASSLLEQIKHKLETIQSTLKLKKEYPSPKDLLPLLNSAKTLIPSADFQTSVGKEFATQTTETISYFTEAISNIQSSVETPKKISAKKNSLNRLEQKKEHFALEKKINSKNLEIQIKKINNTIEIFSDPSGNQKRLEFINEIKNNKYIKYYLEILAQIETRNEPLNTSDTHLKEKIQRIKDIIDGTQEINKKSEEVSFISGSFVENIEEELNNIASALEEDLKPYDTIITSLKSRKDIIEEYCDKTRKYLSTVYDQIKNATSSPSEKIQMLLFLTLIRSDLFYAENLINRLEKILETPFANSLKTLQALNEESFPNLSMQASNLYRTTLFEIPQLPTEISKMSFLNSNVSATEYFEGEKISIHEITNNI